MSTLSNDDHLDKIFTDAKYGVDVVVKYMNDSIVLLKEEKSGNKRICKREDFTDEKRFLPKT